MLIIKHSKKHTVSFESLEVGACFRLDPDKVNSHIYRKIHKVKVESVISPTGYANTYEFKKNRLRVFHDGLLVVPVSVELSYDDISQ